MIDSIFPVTACLMALFTPKGQYKTHNMILAALFIFMFAIVYLGQAEDSPVYDGMYYEAAMFGLYTIASFTFYFTGARVQSILAFSGSIILLGYWYLWAVTNQWNLYFTVDPENNVRYEVLITLYAVQLLAGFRGMAWSILCNMKHGGYNGTRSAFDHLWSRFVHRDHT